VSTEAQVSLALGVLVAVLVLGWYLSFSAGRLDRLHHKVESTRVALDVQLVRRAAAAIEAAAHLDPASALLVTDAATRAMEAGERAEHDQERSGRDPLEAPPELATVESDLTRALQVAFPDPSGVTGSGVSGSGVSGSGVSGSGVSGSGVAVNGPGDDPFALDAVRVLGQACERVQLARRFHNDAVAQAQRIRRKRVVRWARLAGRAPMPTMIEFDDTPAGAPSADR
jgi:hypothetical protein